MLISLDISSAGMKSLRVPRLVCATIFLLSTSLVVYSQTASEILARPDVQVAMQDIQANEPHFVDEQARICEIAAPPFHEEKRAAELARLFREAGLANVRIDRVGNVLGDRPGSARIRIW